MDGATDDQNEIHQDPRVSQPRLPDQAHLFSDPFSEPNLALSRRSFSSSESSSDPILSWAAKPGQPQRRNRLPGAGGSRKAFLLGAGDLSFGPLKPDPFGFSPALAGLTSRGDGHFQPAPPLLPSPLEVRDTESRPPNRFSDLITPTPNTIHNRAGYFGQDAWPARSDHGRAASARVPPRYGVADAATQDGGMVQGSNNGPDIESSVGTGCPTVIAHDHESEYPSFGICPSIQLRTYSDVPSRFSALQLSSPPLDRHPEPLPPFQTPQLGASVTSSPSNGSGLPTPSTRYHTPTLLPSPFISTSYSPYHLSARPFPAHSPASSSRSLSSASRPASRCSSNSSSKSPLRIESHPRLGAILVAPRLKRGTPPPVPVIPEKYRRERSAERWLKPPDNEEEAKGRRGSGGSLGILRQAKSMENLSCIRYEMVNEVAEKVEGVGKHATQSLVSLGVSIPSMSYEPPSFEVRDPEEAGECTNPNRPILDEEITIIAPSFPRSPSMSLLVHGPVLLVDETFEEGMNWLHSKSFQGGSGQIQVEKTPNWFERSRTPSPIRAASPYLTVFQSPARSGECARAKAKANGPGSLAKKLSGSFVKVSRGLRHVTSSSGLGIMISHEDDPSSTSSSTNGSKDHVDGRVTPHESASLSSGSDSAQISGRTKSWKNGERYRNSRWSARDPVVRSLESESSVSNGDRESTVRLVDFLNESHQLGDTSVSSFRANGRAVNLSRLAEASRPLVVAEPAREGSSGYTWIG